MLKLVLPLAAAALSAASAHAEPRYQPASVRVSFADLDLSQTAGRATLDRRLRSAVRSLCERNAAPDILQVRMHVRRCERDALAHARADANAAALNMLGSAERLASR